MTIEATRGYHHFWSAEDGTYVVRRGTETLNVATFVFEADALLFATYRNHLTAIHGTDQIPLKAD